VVSGQKLWKLSEPVNHEGASVFTYVITSAATVIYSGPETCVFPANKNGEFLDMLELPGSYRGGLNHKKAIKGFVRAWKDAE
jgi:hypothetical protein